MTRHQDPVVIIEENGDDTKDFVAGSFDPFNVTVVTNGTEAVLPANRDKFGFYSVEGTLPSRHVIRIWKEDF